MTNVRPVYVTWIHSAVKARGTISVRVLQKEMKGLAEPWVTDSTVVWNAAPAATVYVAAAPAVYTLAPTIAIVELAPVVEYVTLV